MCDPGDHPSEFDAWKFGYKDRSVCLRYPRPPIEEKKQVCSSSCLPGIDSDFAKSNALGCSSVCTGWNRIKVDVAQRHLEIRAQCHVTKDSQCHSANSPMGAALPSNISDPSARRCSSRKHNVLGTVCHKLQNDGQRTHGDGWGDRCQDGSQPLSELANWVKSDRTVMQQDYDEYRRSFDHCKRSCLQDGGCPQGFSFRGNNRCRLPKHATSHQSHLVPNVDWNHYRWGGAAYTLRNDARKWCCWSLSGEGGFSPPDWLQNVPQQQYCATMLLST